MKLRGNGWRRLFARAFVGAGAVWATAALAQPPQYKTDAELMGAAIASPEGVGQVLARLVQKCGLYSAATRTHGNAVLRAWQVRHRDYLDEGRRVRAELQSVYTDPQERARFNDLLQTQFPMLVERQFVVYSRSIDDQTTEPAKAALCDSYFSAVDDRQFDLSVNDPALAAYLDRRIAARAAPASAGNAGSDSPPNAGTEGAAGPSSLPTPPPTQK